MPAHADATPASPPGRGLTLQLVLWVVLPLSALLVIVPFGSLALHGRAMRQLVAERDERAASAAAATISQALHHRQAMVQALAQHTASGAALGEYRFLLPDFPGGLALFAPDGRLLESTGPASEWSGRPVRSLLAPSGAAFSEVFLDAASGEALMLVGASRGSQTAVGAFAPADLVHSAFPEGTLAFHGLPSAFVVDDDGQILYRSSDLGPELALAQHPGVEQALRGEAGSTYLDAEGSEHVVAYAPVPSVGWALVLEEPWEMVEGPLLRRTQAAPLVLVPVVIFAIVVLAFGIRQIVQPLQALERQATELAWGRFEAIETPAGGIGEIRRLQAELVHMARKIRMVQQSLRDYVGAVTAGQEDERRRLARELHDGTIQALIALNQRLQLARSSLGQHATAEALGEAQGMVAQAIDDVRRFIRDLRPIYLEDLGLAPALDMLAREAQERTGIRVEFRADGPERRLSPEVELTLYRMAQEALSNVARHAQASRAWIFLAFEARAVILSVRDDGQGFGVPESPAEFVPRGHFGLLGMHERAELIGARLSIQSRPEAGTTVEVRLPLER